METITQSASAERGTMEERYNAYFHDLNSTDSKNQFKPELQGQLPKHILQFCIQELEMQGEKDRKVYQKSVSNILKKHKEEQKALVEAILGKQDLYQAVYSEYGHAMDEVEAVSVENIKSIAASRGIL